MKRTSGTWPRAASGTPVTVLLALALALIAPRHAEAQWNVARFETERSHVYTTFGLDPAFVGSVGYGHVIPILDHEVQFAIDGGLATAHLDTRDFRARVGAQTSLVRWRSLQLAGSITFITRGTENTIYRGLNFGGDFTASLGVYRHRWFTAGEFGKDKSIITHITHSDWYRKNFYADAKDGWYLDAGGIFHYGVVCGVALGRTEVSARFGWRQTENWKDVMPPMYASLGVGIGL